MCSPPLKGLLSLYYTPEACVCFNNKKKRNKKSFAPDGAHLIGNNIFTLLA